MSLTLRTATVSDVGPVRSNNEDAAYAGRRLVALADGIGGMPSGELASAIVVRALAAIERTAPPGEAGLDALRTTLDEANQTIQQAAQADEAHDGMGTTVTALLLVGDQVALVNVGDSRCYLHRDNHLSQLTKDDTFVQSLVDEGLLTADEARMHPRRSIVTQALQGLSYEASGSLRPVQLGDRYLLCSDGLSDFVTDDIIEQTLSSYPEIEQCAAQLVKLALDGGGSDNVTVVIADVVPD
jgi:PPM family protein phosphatase